MRSDIFANLFRYAELLANKIDAICKDNYANGNAGTTNGRIKGGFGRQMFFDDGRQGDAVSI